MAHQRMNKVSAYVGLYGGLGIAGSILVQPYLLVPIALGAIALEVIKPGSIRKLIDQSKDFAKDVISHVRQDLKRSVNLARRIFGVKTKAETPAAPAAETSSFKAESQQNAFNNSATPEASAPASKVDGQKQNPSAPTP